jgi:NAD-dependent dihydropyrimidine dehydrogenase PreA subunit
MKYCRSHVLVYVDPECLSIGAHEVLDAFQDELVAEGLSDKVQVLETSRIGGYANGPEMMVYPGGLRQGAPNPVESTLKHFRGEYEDSILEKRCPAKVCRSLIRYEIIPASCMGCTACVRNCPTNAISGERCNPHHRFRHLYPLRYLYAGL